MMNEAIKKIGKRIVIAKNEYVFHQKDTAVGFYYVLHGRIRLYRLGSEAKEVEINQVLDGGYLGEAILFASDSYPVSAQAVENSELLFFEKKEFLEHLRRDTAIADFMLKLLSEKCITLNNRIETLNIQTPRQRLIKTFISKCNGNGNCLIDLGMKKNELAKHIGITPEALSRNIKSLQDEQLIEVNGQSVKIFNCSGMKKYL